MPTTPTHEEIAKFLLDHIKGDVQSISIIGSYLINMRLREGSDIDIVVLVKDLKSTTVTFENIFYKDTDIKDSQGERKELNVKLSGVALDITILDPASTNPPNNPLTDYYENFLGLCISSHAIYGESLAKLLDVDGRIAHYATIRSKRLQLVEEKIQMTKRKIVEQGRHNIYTIYELQRYIFIRECISRGIFNQLSIKNAEKVILGFNALFEQELANDCGLRVLIEKVETA